MTNEITVQDLDLIVRNLYDKGAYHIKRGFQLGTGTLATATNHFLEESVELQAEVTCNGTYASIIDKAADVLVVYLHLLYKSGVPLQNVINTATVKLDQNFTLDKSKIKTDTPGFTRRARRKIEKVH